MELYDQNKFNTTSRVGNLFFDFANSGKSYITLQNLLEHNSGLQATYTAAFPKTPTELLKSINNLKLEYTTEDKFVLSELGPIVLG
jgi:CubicO group peptidase (beta-lactamase class C family)